MSSSVTSNPPGWVATVQVTVVVPWSGKELPAKIQMVRKKPRVMCITGEVSRNATVRLSGRYASDCQDAEKDLRRAGYHKVCR